MEVVVDHVLNELLRLFAVAYELTLGHIEPPLVGLDLIAFSFFACAIMRLNGERALSALVVNGGVRE